MSDESTEKTETTEEPQAEETQATEAPAAEAAPAAPAAPEPEPAEPDPLDDLPRKERLRILKSREPHKAGPQRTTEERIADREAIRKQKANERRKERAAMKAEHKTSTGTPEARATRMR